MSLLHQPLAVNLHSTLYVKLLLDNKPACRPLVPGDVATAEAVVDAVLDLVNMLNSSWR